MQQWILSDAVNHYTVEYMCYSMRAFEDEVECERASEWSFSDDEVSLEYNHLECNVTWWYENVIIP